MLNKRFSLLFYLKKAKNSKQEKSPIYLRITVESERSEISVQRSCEPSRWNVHSGRANGTKEEIRSLNSYLDTIQIKAYEVHRSLIDEELPVTAESVKNKLLGIKEKVKTVLQVYHDHNDRVKQLVGKDFSPTTLKRYTTSLEHTKKFIEWKYKLPDLEITKLDYDFIDAYAFWLKSVRNCNQNSTIKYLSNFKKVIFLCIKNGWLDKDPFSNFKLARKEVIRTALTETELRSIFIRTFVSERLNQVKDIFLFSCYTGLAYTDVQKLKKLDVIIGVDGEKWLSIKRQKTHTASRVPLLPVALDLVEKYADHPQCSSKGTVLPILSNQKMNAYLKEIADICGINKVMTFHLARHTFATTVTLSNGVPIESVSQMLGHKSIRQTQHYAKILDVKVSEDMKNLKQKLISL